MTSQAIAFDPSNVERIADRMLDPRCLCWWELKAKRCGLSPTAGQELAQRAVEELRSDVARWDAIDRKSLRPTWARVGATAVRRAADQIRETGTK